MRARLLLLVATLAAYGGSLLAGFHLDDYAIFTDPLLRSWHGVRPLTQLSFALNYQIAGQEPIVFHAFNLLLHLAAVLLAFECLRRLLSANAALIAAAIFAVHPLQAEAVHYIWERDVLLAAVFCFAALLCWMERQPWLAVLAFAAATLSDPRCAMFPLVLVLIPVGERAKIAMQERIALVVLFVISTAAMVGAHVGIYQYARASLRFVGLFLVPWGFTVFPDVHEPFWLAAVAALAVAALAVWKWRTDRLPAELTWLLLALILMIPSFSGSAANDPRAYLPVFALAAAVAVFLDRVDSRALSIATIAIFTLAGVSRTYVWTSEERVWREAVRRAPDAALPKIQLARQVKAAEALELLAKARTVDPHNVEIPVIAGKVLLDEQQYEGALDELTRAVALNPKNAQVFNNRGVALAQLGFTERAAADFEHAVELDPQLTEAQENLKRLGVK